MRQGQLAQDTDGQPRYPAQPPGHRNFHHTNGIAGPFMDRVGRGQPHGRFQTGTQRVVVPIWPAIDHAIVDNAPNGVRRIPCQQQLANDDQAGPGRNGFDQRQPQRRDGRRRTNRNTGTQRRGQDEQFKRVKITERNFGRDRRLPLVNKYRPSTK